LNYGPAKNAANKAKHGIDFDEAQKLWEYAYALTAGAGATEESRCSVVAEQGLNCGQRLLHTEAWQYETFQYDAPGQTRSKTMKREKKKLTPISTEEFDRKFDDGEDISEYVDWDSATHINLKPKVVNVSFPTWMVEALDREAAKMGITRQSLIKVVVNEHLLR